MAKIHGVELKGLTKFRGYCGKELTQGNIYFIDKKIGSYSEDYLGGCMEIDIERSYLDEFREIVTSYFKGVNKYEDKYDAYFIYELLDLLNKEKQLKNTLKEGFKGK